jgi:hypothetical protein
LANCTLTGAVARQKERDAFFKTRSLIQILMLNFNLINNVQDFPVPQD